MKGVLVAIVLVTLTESGLAGEIIYHSRIINNKLLSPSVNFTNFSFFHSQLRSWRPAVRQ